MNTETQTAISIFKCLFERYQKEMLDDETEFVPMVKDILDGVASVSETPESTKASVLEYVESCYVSNWDAGSRDQAQREFRKMLAAIKKRA